MNPLSIGDLIILEIAVQKFLEGLDLSLEAGKHCTQIIGKLENLIAQATATAMSSMPDFLHKGDQDAPPFKPTDA